MPRGRDPGRPLRGVAPVDRAARIGLLRMILLGKLTAMLLVILRAIVRGVRDGCKSVTSGPLE